MSTLLELRDLTVAYATRRGKLTAVAGVSLKVEEARTLSLIGESGSGKSSIARAVCGLHLAESGQVLIGGRDLTAEGRNQPVAAGKAGIQIVFQDPVAALDPRWPVWRAIAEPRLARVKASEAEHRSVAIRLMERVGLSATYAERKPHRLSGGQRQRVTVARALAADPKLIILDEAVSALDVSVRNEILTLLDGLRAERGLTYLFISHDMGAVAQMSRDVAVLYLGRLMEFGAAEEVIGRPAHPYTRALIAAVPTLDTTRRATARAIGDTDDPVNPPPGCRFHRRCPFVVERCRVDVPEERAFDGRMVACHRVEEIDRLPN
jgi:oligopeptide/dipeptide ABC transporter ATP-binding protein